MPAPEPVRIVEVAMSASVILAVTLACVLALVDGGVGVAGSPSQAAAANVLSAADIIAIAFGERATRPGGRPPPDLLREFASMSPASRAKLDAGLLRWMLMTHLAGAPPPALPAFLRPAASPDSMRRRLAASSLPRALRMRVPSLATQPVRVVVETSDLEAAQSAGLEVRSAYGAIATGSIAAGRLPALAAERAVRRIWAPHRLTRLNDEGRKDVRVPEALARYAADGRGTLVGVLDTGLDFQHATFRELGGSTRVVRMLDFAYPGDPDGDGVLDGPVAGGTEYTREQIDAALRTGNGWESRAVNGTVAPGETARFVFGLEFDRPITTLHTQLHLEGDLSALQIALQDPEGGVYPLNLAPDPTWTLQATYLLPVPAGSRIAGDWVLVVRNNSPDAEVYISSWAFFVDRTVFMQDLSGHGTHVAGTAAGNGRVAAGATFYSGVAPEAGLLFVRGERDLDSFATDDVIAGIHWTDQAARVAGLPYALNLSLGGSYGPHDGTEPEDKAIDAVAGEGRPGGAIVVANGNAGDEAMHSEGVLAPGADTLDFVVAPEPGEEGVDSTWAYVALEGTGTPRFGLTYPYPDELTCTTYAYDAGGSAVGPLSDCTAISRLAAGSAILFELTDEAGDSATIGTIVWERGDQAHLLTVEWYSTETYWVMPGDWSLTVSGFRGRWDGWKSGCMPFVACDNAMTVTSPATARAAIAVGAYNTRIWWTDSRGELRRVEEDLGDLASFSSHGPTRDGRVKPELAAPGQKIISARSRDRALCPYVHRLFCEEPELGWPDDVSGELLALQGTSMAAPMVTGAAALLLQLRPDLTAADIKQILTATARTDAATRPQPEPSDWGAGKLDVAGALESIASAPPPRATIYLPTAKDGA
jgi:subtilisin family serine protease